MAKNLREQVRDFGKDLKETLMNPTPDRYFDYRQQTLGRRAAIYMSEIGVAGAIGGVLALLGAGPVLATTGAAYEVLKFEASRSMFMQAQAAVEGNPYQTLRKSIRLTVAASLAGAVLVGGIGLLTAGPAGAAYGAMAGGKLGAEIAGGESAIAIAGSLVSGAIRGTRRLLGMASKR